MTQEKYAVHAESAIADLDAASVVSALDLPSGPVALEALRRRLEAHPDWAIDGMATADGVPGLEADEIVLLFVTYRPGPCRGSVLCQRVGRATYVVEGISLIPTEEPPSPGVKAPVWTYQDYRVVVWSDESHRPHYGVEQRDGAGGGWRRAEDWAAQPHPDSIGGVLDCLLWLKQKGQL